MKYIMLALSLFLSACGVTVSEVARHTVATAAIGVAAVDVQAARIYEQRAAEALAESSTLAQYLESMRGLDSLVVALRVAHASLLGVEAALDAGDAHDIGSTIACLVGALNGLADALRAAGIELPKPLLDAITMASTFAGACHE